MFILWKICLFCDNVMIALRQGMDFNKIHKTVEHMILAMVQIEKSFGGKMLERQVSLKIV